MQATDENIPVTIRRRWDDRASARVRLADLRDVRIGNDPGGMCAAAPRGFLRARLWCDRLSSDGGVHPCDPASAPHELEVCALEVDNSRATIALVNRLRQR